MKLIYNCVFIIAPGPGFARTWPGLGLKPDLGHNVVCRLELPWQENLDFYTVLRHVVDDCMTSGWRWLDTVDEFILGKGVQYIALVTKDQQCQQAG